MPNWGEARGSLGRPLTRRRVLRYGAGAASKAQHELRHPTVLRSHHGKLRVKLTCRPGVVDMGAPKPVTTYTYDGIVPGYTWELRGGDVLRVDLRNHLPKLPPQPPM